MNIQIVFCLIDGFFSLVIDLGCLQDLESAWCILDMPWYFYDKEVYFSGNHSRLST